MTPAWTRFWFEPRGPERLAACRIVFYGALLALYARLDVRTYGDLPAETLRPIGFFALGVPIATPALLGLLTAAWKVALALSCAGLATRAAAPLAFGLGAYVLGVPHNFGKIDHSDAALVLILGILAASRCGDALSLDAALARRRGAAPPAPSGEYTWPTRLACATLASVYFAAGIAKLRASGLEWVLSDNMGRLLAGHAPWRDIGAAWGPALATSPLACRALAAAAILLELSAPLALLRRRLCIAIVSSLFLMHVGIFLLMGIRFTQLAACALLWLPWEEGLAGVRRRARKDEA